MRIIVNADDYGINKKCTMAICDAFARGLLSQTTTMVNMPWFEQGIKLAKANGFFSRVGLHFNLTEGSALTKAMRDCRFFCDADGMFTGDFHRSLKTRLVIPKDAVNALKQEATAQIERYISAGYELMHLDSHHHVHTDFAIARILLPLAKQDGFKTARISRTISAVPMSMMKRGYKLLFNAYLRQFVNPVANDFTDLSDFMQCYKQLPATASIEIMVHPGQEGEVPVEEAEKFWKQVQEQNVRIER